MRIYGRRAGAKQPLWKYGFDFGGTSTKVTEPIPEFAATHTNDLEEFLHIRTGELVMHPVLTPERSPTDKKGKKNPTSTLVQAFQVMLLRTQLFVPADQNIIPRHVSKSKLEGQGMVNHPQVAIVWAIVGVLLTVQVDWLIAQMIFKNNQTPKEALTACLGAEHCDQNFAQKTINTPSLANQDRNIKQNLELPPGSLQKFKEDNHRIFNSSEFAKPGNELVITQRQNPAKKSPIATTKELAKPEVSTLVASPLLPSATQSAILAAARSPYRTFKSSQLDEKLALYQQRIAQSGPPDILIVGSSRAIRGIDPVALQTSLARAGYPNMDIFNFGINGATAQVVDLLIRQILPPEQLPKMIIWADGARAFNSGRIDVTYNAIAVSDGYKELASRTDQKIAIEPKPANSTNLLSEPGAKPAAEVPLSSMTANYRNWNEKINNLAGSVSQSYPQRDRLKNALSENLSKWNQSDPILLSPENEKSDSSISSSWQGIPTNDETVNWQNQQQVSDQSIDINGFLPISIRFEPATYYQMHPRVSGDYDGDYQFFRLEGKQESAFISFLDFTQTHRIPVLFINLPLTQDYLDSSRMEYEKMFTKYMFQLALEKGFRFRDLSQIWLNQNDFFTDPSHLNRYGAYSISQYLAQDNSISWPLKK